MFESTSFRRNLGERLTEAVVKRSKTEPYKVVSDPNADSVLTGRIVRSESTRAPSSPATPAETQLACGVK
jgi:hypothetical protein